MKCVKVCASPLWYAVAVEDLHLVHQQLSEGQDVNRPEIFSGQTPVIIATIQYCQRPSKSKMLMIEVLIKKGADINLADKGGDTPLSEAVKANDPSLVDYFAKAGADFNDPCLMNFALEKKNREIVNMFLKHDVDVYATDHNGVSPLMKGLALAAGERENVEVIKRLVNEDLNGKTSYGLTLLITSVKVYKSSPWIFDHLLELPIDVNAPDDYGNTALYFAFKELGPRHKVIYKLIRAGFDVNRDLYDFNWNMEFQQFRFFDHTPWLNFLLVHGADVNSTNDAGRTPLMRMLLSANNVLITKRVASMTGWYSVSKSYVIKRVLFYTKFLLQAGAMPRGCQLSREMSEIDHLVNFSNILMVEVFTPVLGALWTQSLQVVRLLLDHHCLTSHDVSLTPWKKNFIQRSLPSQDLKFRRFMKDFFCRPRSLRSVCLAMVSTDLGFESDRGERVAKTGLPRQLQHQLMFGGRVPVANEKS